MADAAKQSHSVAGIVGLILGIFALILSWMPIINNFAFVIALIGLVFSIMGVVVAVRGKRSGKSLAIVALIINIASFAMVLGTQSAYSAAIDDAVNGPQVTSTSDDNLDTSSDDASQEETPASMDLEVGTVAELENGLSVVVDSVQTGLVNYDGSSITGIHVTYTNNSEGSVSYNSLDWKGQDAQGAAETCTFYADSTDELSSGDLAAGGTVSGNLYFKGDTVKALYYVSALSDEPTASWTLA